MDRRDRNHKWYSRFDEERMVIVLEEATRRKVSDHEFEGSEEYEGDDELCAVCQHKSEDHAEDSDAMFMGDLEIPAVYEVCGTCDGKGKHVNPSIDAHGLSREDFDEDPGFREDYFSGRYDIQCNECHGARVTPVVSDHAPEELKRIAEKWIDDLRDMEACYEAERRMGA